MPAFIVAVTEGDDVGEIVVVVDDEGEITHGFIAFVDGDGEGGVGARIDTVFGDEIDIFGPCWVDFIHPATIFLSLRDHHKGFFYGGILCDIMESLCDIIRLLPRTVFEDMYNKEEEDGNEDENVKGKGVCI